MAAAVETQDNLVKIIKEFAVQLQPHLNMANIDKIEDMLIHMEESDGGHEMKALVKFIRRKLTSKLSSYLDEEIEKHSQLSHIDADQQEKLVDVIFDKVQKSKQFLDCRQSIDSSVTDAVNYLLENFETEMYVSTHSKEPRSDFDRNSLTVSDDSSLSFSLTQTAFLFVGQEQLLLHAQGIQRQRSYNDRLENLRSLSQMPVSDLLNAECWPLIRKGLLECLVTDDDDKLWMAAFKCCTRGLSFNSPPSKDLYMLLVDYVHQTILRKFSSWKISNGFDSQNPVLARLAKVLKILNEYQQQITNYWVRFSQERFLEEIVDATLGFMTVQPNIEILSPYHLVAMIDMEAYWLRAWTHASYSRLPLFRLLEKHKTLFQMAVTCIFNYAAKPRDVSSIQHETKHNRTGSNGAEMSSPSSPLPTNPTAPKQTNLRYNDAALQHLALLSSMHILRYLLSYKQGCRFFPVKVRNEQISLKQLLIELVRIISHPCAMINKPSYQPMNPSFVATDVLKHLCSCTSVRGVIYSDDFISALMVPVCWNPSTMVGAVSGGSSDSAAAEHYNNVLLLIAHVFSALAFDEDGKAHLLFGESLVKAVTTNRPSSSTSTSAAAVHTLIRFVVSNMESDVLWRRVLGAYIYLCRQLYTSCQGLEVMKPYCLHKRLAEAKVRSAAETKFAEMERSASVTTLVNDDVSANESFPRERSGSRGKLAAAAVAALDEVGTVTSASSAGGVGNISGRFSRERLSSSKPSLAAFWDETLKDNLLGFASTPGGLYLLCATGFFRECVSHMVQRYSSGIQMSKYENYGYGSMVSQIAATLPGSEALAKSTSLISDFISNLWCKIETVPGEEASMGIPPPWPVHAIDRSQHKPFIRLLNVVTPYPSVWFQLNSVRLPNRDSYTYHDQPRSFVELIDRIVFVNSDAKVLGLYNYDQSCAIGLRLLSCVCANLNSFVLLENRFSVVDWLLRGQRESFLEDRGEFMLDELSLIRNRILVWIGALGGPSEKMLPPYELIDDEFGSKNKLYPFFGQLPFPKAYLKKDPTSNQSRSPPVDRLLSSMADTSTGLDADVAVQVRDALLAWLSKKPNLSDASNLTVLQNVMLALARSRNSSCQIPLPPTSRSPDPGAGGDGKDDNIWVMEMVVEYGMRIGFLEGSKQLDFVAGLRDLLRSSEEMLAAQQVAGKIPSHLSDSFDWFVAVIFLLFKGDASAAASFLKPFSDLAVSLFLWPKRCVNYVGLNDTYLQSGLTPLFAHTYHYVQWILQEQLPLVSSALKMSGFSCSQLCDHWLCQTFLNYLDLPEIFVFVALCLAAGPDYVAYANVALYDHLRVSIAQAHHEQVLQLKIKEQPIAGFSFCDHLSFMQDLELKYRKSILIDLATIFTNSNAR